MTLKRFPNGSKITDEEIRKLVIARLRSFSSGRKISIGSEGAYTKDELIDCVSKGDEVGKKIIEIQLQYLRSLKEGFILPD